MDGRNLDPRAKRSRDAIVAALTELALRQRYDTIRTADLIALAGVGRSTFYEHFRGKDEVLLAAMAPILQPLASAALGRASKIQVRAMLEHVWQQRGLARIILGGAAGIKLQRRLAAMIEARLVARPDAAPPAMVAIAAAAAQLTMLRMWVAGEAACPPADLAGQMLACARLLPEA
jgi:AcrR family transcriptional regulator